MNNSVSWNYLHADRGFRTRQRLSSAASAWNLTICAALFATIVGGFYYVNHQRVVDAEVHLGLAQAAYDQRANERRKILALTNDLDARDATLVGKIEIIRASGGGIVDLYSDLGGIRPHGTWLNRIEVTGSRMTIEGGAHSLADASDYYSDLSRNVGRPSASLPKFEIHNGPRPFVVFTFNFGGR